MEHKEKTCQNDLNSLNHWLEANTYQSSQFKNLQDLYNAKRGRTISLIIPTLNEEKTIADIVSKILGVLNDDFPIIDELIVIDGGSTDDTVVIVRELTLHYEKLQVIDENLVLPEINTKKGKGNQLWKGLYYSSGDIVLYCDSDIRNFDIHMIYGLIGPLLSGNIKFIKGFYDRSLVLHEHVRTPGGGRVTELCARPLLNLFYPQLSGFIQPLGGEYGAYRELLENIEYTSGYGVEINILIDVFEKYGIATMGQVDLICRDHRHQNIGALSMMSFTIMNVVLRKNKNLNLHNNLLMKKYKKNHNSNEKCNNLGEIDLNKHFMLLQNSQDDFLPPLKQFLAVHPIT
tara:strand:+ start:22 stop:1056 length:1035 start_codon:yes stop_codon:yes gene_type:complete